MAIRHRTSYNACHSAENHRLGEILQRICHRNRRAALVDLSYDVILPAYTDRQCAKFETNRDKQQNDQVQTDAVHTLYALLHSWDNEPAALSDDRILSLSRQAAVGRISWTQDAYSPTDAHHRKNVDDAT